MKRLVLVFAVPAAATLFALGGFGAAQEGGAITSRYPFTVPLQQTGSATIEFSEPCSAAEEKIVSAALVDGRLEIVKRGSCYPNAVPAIACFPKPCDWTIRKVWRDVYGVQGGRLLI
jgi:hypothetical protein